MLDVKFQFGTENRRSSIKEDCSFSNLWSTVKNLFSNRLRENLHIICWRDEEADQITISSDEELACAIRSLGKMNVAVYKFEIIEKQVDVIPSNSFSSLGINLSPNHKIFDKFGKAFSLRDGE